LLRSPRAIAAVFALAGLCGLVNCSPNRWLPNTFGAFAISDVTGDGYDDYVGWFDNFDKMTRTRLTVIDGRTGKYHYSCIGNSGHLAALLGQRAVTAADSWYSKPIRYSPEIGLYDLAAARVVSTKNVSVSLSQLCTVDQGVFAVAGSDLFIVDPIAGTINPIAAGPAKCVNTATISDVSKLEALDVQAWPPAITALGLASVRTRNLTPGTSVWVGPAAGTNTTVAARLQNGQVLWSARLGSNPKPLAWTPQNAVGNDARWFIPYIDGSIARLAALDAATGALAWDVEVLAPKGDVQTWHVCAMSAGPQLVGLAHKRVNDCDELVLFDAVTGTIAFRYRRN